MKDQHTPERIAQSADDILRDFTSACRATHAIVCFDTKPTWRHELFPGYKSSRTTDTQPWLEAARVCFEQPTTWRARRRCVSVDRYEADDVVATLAHRAAGRAELDILSSDTDLLVLTVLRNTCCWRFGSKKKDEPYFVPQWREQVIERFGVPPEKLGDYKAIVGEEDVPGLPKHGAVAARRLLADDGTIERACALNQQYADQLRLAKKLLVPVCDAPVPPVSPRECAL
jgi:DNA polymerase-1